MSLSQYLLLGSLVLIALVIGFLDAWKRRQAAERLARMTPEDRAIAERESKVFRSSIRRGR